MNKKVKIMGGDSVMTIPESISECVEKTNAIQKLLDSKPIMNMNMEEFYNSDYIKHIEYTVSIDSSINDIFYYIIGYGDIRLIKSHYIILNRSVNIINGMCTASYDFIPQLIRLDGNVPIPETAVCIHKTTCNNGVTFGILCTKTIAS